MVGWLSLSNNDYGTNVVATETTLQEDVLENMKGET
jgi:hypothetical protein